MITGRRLRAGALLRLFGNWKPGRGDIASSIQGHITQLVCDGRLPFGTHLPSERDLAHELGVSRTTVAAVYDRLRAGGHVETRQGAGSWVARRHAEASETAAPWYPVGTHEEIDLTQAALPAPTELFADLLARAAPAASRYGEGHGYYLYGLPELRAAIARRYTDRGVPTTPGQILVTTGAQNALALCLAAILRPGSRVLIEHPTYPNALAAIRRWGGSCVPVDLDPDGWDFERFREAVREARPELIYCVPDCHNPTGLIMPEDCRARLADMARLSGAALVVDETLTDLALDDPPPAPLSRFTREGMLLVSLGSLSKVFWGGLRVGWMRGPEAFIARAAAVKATIDMATPVLDQILACHVLAELDTIVAPRRAQLRANRAALMDILATSMPSWQAGMPSGGISTWVRLGAPVATRLSEVSRKCGVVITPGPLFGIDGSFEDYIRLPLTLTNEVLPRAIQRLVNAWTAVRDTRAAEPHSLVATV